MKFPISIDHFAQKVEILCESTWCMQINTDKGTHVNNSGNILLLIALHSLSSLGTFSYDWFLLLQSRTTSLFPLSLYTDFLNFFSISKVWLKASSALRLLSVTVLKSSFFNHLSAHCSGFLGKCDCAIRIYLLKIKTQFCMFLWSGLKQTSTC